MWLFVRPALFQKTANTAILSAAATMEQQMAAYLSWAPPKYSGFHSFILKRRRCRFDSRSNGGIMIIETAHRVPFNRKHKRGPERRSWSLARPKRAQQVWNLRVEAFSCGFFSRFFFSLSLSTLSFATFKIRSRAVFGAAWKTASTWSSFVFHFVKTDSPKNRCWGGCVRRMKPPAHLVAVHTLRLALTWKSMTTIEWSSGFLDWKQTNFGNVSNKIACSKIMRYKL